MWVHLTLRVTQPLSMLKIKLLMMAAAVLLPPSKMWLMVWIGFSAQLFLLLVLSPPPYSLEVYWTPGNALLFCAINESLLMCFLAWSVDSFQLRVRVFRLLVIGSHWSHCWNFHTVRSFQVGSKPMPKILVLYFTTIFLPAPLQSCGTLYSLDRSWTDKSLHIQNGIYTDQNQKEPPGYLVQPPIQCTKFTTSLILLNWPLFHT